MLLYPGNVGYGRARLLYYERSGLVQANIPSSEQFVRPSISLKYNTKFESGDGTSTNPYVVK